MHKASEELQFERAQEILEEIRSIDYIQEKQRVEKKEFRFFNQDITYEFNKTISDPNIQAEAMELSNHFENQETRELNRIREEDSTPPQNNYKQNQDIYSYEQEDEYERDY